MDTTTIQTLRIISRERDAHALRFNLERALQTIDWQPSGLPPAAILYIRKLRDPRPGALNLARGDRLRPSPAWRQALTTTLEQMAHQAVRPMLGTPPANTSAVLFLDRAELLACLACDWLEDVLVTNWWWRSLLASRLLLGQALQTTVLTTWGEAVEFVPAALHHLAQSGYAIRFAKQLAAADTYNLLQGITQQFGLAAVQQVLIQAVDGTHNTSNDKGKATTVTASSGHLVTPASPWQRWAPELDGNDLSPDQAVLLGVALGLQRHPAGVRTPAFAQAMQTWLIQRSRTNGRRGAAESVDDGTADPVSLAAQVQPEASTAQALSLADDTQRIPDDSSQMEQAGSGILDLSTQPEPFYAKPAIRRVNTDRLMVVKTDALEQQVQPALPHARSLPLGDMAAAPALSADQARSQIWGAPGASETIVTNYGGLFYLINLGIYLKLYADFTTPLAVGIDLNIYDFIALVGEQLVGEPLYGDPVWALLAQLAGRIEDELPGHNFTPPAHQPSNLTLPAWLAQQMLVIQSRLAAALGEDDPAQVAQLVCAQPARVSVSATRIDVTFALAQHPIQIRLSGLDRDPGWVPAAGRFVAFHFE